MFQKKEKEENSTAMIRRFFVSFLRIINNKIGSAIKNRQNVREVFPHKIGV